jgi:NADH-quinone oxidoreductase subunit C
VSAGEHAVTSYQVPSPERGVAGEPLPLDELRARLVDHFSVETDVVHGELTVFVSPRRLVEVLRFCRDELDCEMLADLGGVHWPAGDHVVQRQTSTTGWPEYRVSRDEGVIEVTYVLRSISRNHRLRVVAGTPDDEPRLPSVVELYPTANYHEREVYDFFGVEFEGHPNLTRILMPDDWLGHPHRKDYPLGGVTIDYKNDKFIPPPHERDLREVVE